MWKMTLKQRRRHGELLGQLDKLRRNPFAIVPTDFVEGDDPEQDKKYQETFTAIKTVVEEIQALETAVADNA